MFRSALGLFEHRMVRIVVSIALICALLTFIDVGEALQVLKQAHPGLLVLGFALFVPDRLFAAYRWFVLLRKDNPDLRYFDTLRLTLVSSFLGFFFPGQIGVEIVRIYGLRLSKIDMAASVSSVLIERYFAIFGLLVLLILGLALVPRELAGVAITLAAIFVAVMAVTMLVVVSPQARRKTRAITPAALYSRLGPKLERFYAAIDRYRDQSSLLWFSLVIGVLFQVFRLSHVFVFAMALQIDIGYLLFLALMPLIRLITMVPITIAGIGLRETAFVFMLGAAAVPPESALTLAVLMFSANILANLPGALFVHSIKAQA